MKLFLTLSLFTFLNTALASDIILDLKALEQKYNIKLTDITYKKVEQGKNKKIKIIQDAQNNLRPTDKDNFIFHDEKMSIELFKNQMKKSGGSRVGNGGDVLVCGNRLEVLDSYRAKNYSSIDLSIDSETSIQSVIHKLELTIPHLARSLSKFYLNYKERTQFSETTYWSPETELINIKDEQLMSKIPNECSLVQAVVRFKTKRKVYFYNQSIFNKLPKSQLSWILIHEWLWDFLDSSSDIRDVNHFLHSNTFNESQSQELANFLNQYDFKIKEEQFLDNINKQQEYNFNILNGLQDTFNGNLSVKESNNLLFTLAEQLSKLNFSNASTIEVDENLEALFSTLISYLQERINILKSKNSNKLEAQEIKEILEVINNDNLDSYSKIMFISGRISVLKIKIRTQIGMAKVYIQNRYWSIFPKSRESKLRELSNLDTEFDRGHLTIEQYMFQLFDIFKIKRPKRFRNL